MPSSLHEQRVLVDTGAMYALWNKDDALHEQAVAIQTSLAHEHRSVFSTWFLVAETHALILRYQGHDSARRWLAALRLPLEPVADADMASALRIIAQHRDKDYSLADAISFAVMARLGTRYVFTFDSHFRQHGLLPLDA